MDALQIFLIAQEEANEQENRHGRQHQRAPRVFRDRVNPLEEYDEEHFIRRFRVSKDTLNDLLGLLRLDLEHPPRRSNALPAVLQLACAMRFFACGTFQIVAGDTSGISQQACGQAMHRVAAAICAIKPHFMRFPGDLSARRRVTQGFQERAGFPRVVGAIDGSHVPL